VILLIVLFTVLGTLVWSPKQQNGGYLIGGVGDQTVIYSSDGETWSAGVDVDGNIPFGTTGHMVYLNYAACTWVAVGDPNVVNGKSTAWSNDGKLWNYGTGEKFGSLSSSFGRTVQYGDGIWVAGGTTGNTSESTILWSYDGKDWNSAVNDPFGATTNGTCSHVFYNNGLWLVGGNSGTTGVNIWWSTDGKNWTASTGDPFGTSSDGGPGNFVYGNGRYVNCGTNPDGSEPLWYSNDGKYWQTATHSFVSVIGKDIAYANNIFVATAQNTGDTGTLIQYSTDGKTFVSATVPGTLGIGSSFSNVTGREGSFWLAWGRNETTGIIYMSDDGRTWTNVTPDNFFPSTTGLPQTGTWGKYDGTWRFVLSGASSSGSNVWRTEDGENWTAADNALFGTGVSKGGIEARWSSIKV